MKLKIVAVMLAVVAAVVVYVVVFRTAEPPSQMQSQSEKACGSADLRAGADAESCRQHALDLIGREPERHEDAGRALLKKLCDQAFEQACKDLADYPCLKLSLDDGRCSGAWFKPPDGKACLAVAQAYDAHLCGTGNPQVVKDSYAKACQLGVSEACGK